MTCERELRLVEKLADGEAEPSERIEAEAHLEICEDCRAHYELVRALETASKEFDLPEPPEAYWQHFPSKVAARIEREERRERSGFWQNLLSPAVLRFGAVAATLTVVVAVGVSVYRDDPGSLEPDGLPTAERFETVEREDGFASPGEGTDSDAEEPDAPEAGARSAPARDADSPVSQLARDREPSSSPAPDRPREVENLSAFERRAEPGLVAEESVEGEERDAESVGRRQNQLRRSLDEKAEPSMADEVAPPAERAAAAEPPPAALRSSRKEAGEAGVSAARALVPDRCGEWRRYLEENGDEGSQSREARYQVALCALRDYEAAPSEATRRAAIRDAEAFLALEDDTDRAEPIRSRLNELRE